MIRGVVSEVVMTKFFNLLFEKAHIYLVILGTHFQVTNKLKFLGEPVQNYLADFFR